MDDAPTSAQPDARPVGDEPEEEEEEQEEEQEPQRVRIVRKLTADGVSDLKG